MELKDVLESKIYLKEGGAVQFQSPKFYIEPFLKSIQNGIKDYVVSVANPISNKNVDTDEVNTAYPKVLVEAKVGTHVEGFDSVIGLLYNLDGKPIIKAYSGENARACLNLTIFNAEYVFEQSLLTDYREIYAKTKLWKDNKEKEAEEFKNTLKSLKDSYITKKELNELIGNLLFRSAKSRIGTSPIVQATKYLQDPSSAYYIYQGSEFVCNQWNVFNSITQALNGSDMISKPTKTVSLAKLFLN